MEKKADVDRTLLGAALTALGALLIDEGHRREAEDCFRRALPFFEQHTESNGIHPVICLGRLAEVVEAKGERDEAEQLYRRAVFLCETSGSIDASTKTEALQALAAFLCKQGDFTAAEPLLAEVVRLREDNLGQRHDSTITGRLNLGICLKNMAERDRAEPHLRYAFEQFEQLALTDKTLNALDSLADLSVRKQSWLDAAELFRKALELHEKRSGSNNDEYVQRLYRLADALRHLGQYQAVAECLQRIVHLDERRFGAEHQEVAVTVCNLGMTYFQSEDFRDAELQFRRALDIWRRSKGSAHPDVLMVKTRLAECLMASGAPAGAIPYLKEIAEVQRSAADDDALPYTLSRLAQCLYASGDIAATLAVHREEELVGRRRQDWPAIIKSLVNQGTLRLTIGDNGGGPLVLEARRLAVQHNLPEHVQRIETLLGR
jgi:tetratricopeptide (TPR) repeat protein